MTNRLRTHPAIKASETASDAIPMNWLNLLNGNADRADLVEAAPEGDGIVEIAAGELVMLDVMAITAVAVVSVPVGIVGRTGFDRLRNIGHSRPADKSHKGRAIDA